LKDEETGLLTEVGSQNLANALLRLLHDESLREKMGRQGRDFVSSTLSWDVCTRKMVEVYREAKSLA
jgi:glycosyltransferase involved in cell wall biosynthesis